MYFDDNDLQVWTLGDRWLRHCDGKIDYPNRALAEVAAMQMRHKERDEFNAYHCECCGGWHIGHRSAHHTSKRPPTPSVSFGRGPNQSSFHVIQKAKVRRV